jgi:hypothetical protein
MVTNICSSWQELAKEREKQPVLDLYGPLGLSVYVRHALRMTETILTRDFVRYHELVPDGYDAGKLKEQFPDVNFISTKPVPLPTTGRVEPNPGRRATVPCHHV